MATARNSSTPVSDALPDAPRDNWVDRAAPATWKPYLKLARFDRPIGAWLLLFPCWWSQVLAEHAQYKSFSRTFGISRCLYIGAFVMRGAGCTL
jgi:4-hydroxybenzoate polyprenyltransferase